MLEPNYTKERELFWVMGDHKRSNRSDQKHGAPIKNRVRGIKLRHFLNLTISHSLIIYITYAFLTSITIVSNSTNIDDPVQQLASQFLVSLLKICSFAPTLHQHRCHPPTLDPDIFKHLLLQNLYFFPISKHNLLCLEPH